MSCKSGFESRERERERESESESERESQFNTTGDSEFQVRGAAALNAQTVARIRTDHSKSAVSNM